MPAGRLCRAGRREGCGPLGRVGRVSARAPSPRCPRVAGRQGRAERAAVQRPLPSQHRVAGPRPLRGGGGSGAFRVMAWHAWAGELNGTGQSRSLPSGPGAGGGPAVPSVLGPVESHMMGEGTRAELIDAHGHEKKTRLCGS